MASRKSCETRSLISALATASLRLTPRTWLWKERRRDQLLLYSQCNEVWPAVVLEACGQWRRRRQLMRMLQPEQSRFRKVSARAKKWKSTGSVTTNLRHWCVTWVGRHSISATEFG